MDNSLRLKNNARQQKMTQNELKDLIKISGLTVKAFAFEIGVKERTIYNYLSGKQIPMTVVILIRKTFYKPIDFK